MRTLFIKPFLFLLLLLTTPIISIAQNDSLAKRKSFWIPKGAIVQHGGSIGYISLGASYNINKSGSGTLDFYYGNVPHSKGGTLHILASKVVWRPVKIKIGKNLIFHPVNPGLFLSYHMGRNFDAKWDDDEYPKGYYWWSTAFRPHIAIGNELKFDTSRLTNKTIKYVSFYSEFNTNELYLISYFQNTHDLNLHKIFKLGLGIRAYF